MSLALIQQRSSSNNRSISSGTSISGWIQQHISSSPFSPTRAPSMHGGAGGLGTQISQSSSYYSSGSMGSYGSTSVIGNEKATMQDLNDRLADYLEKVHTLEAANKELEINIREYCKKTTSVTRNYAGYFSTIDDLRKEIARSYADNQSLLLQIDNAQLTADDFKMKFETEMNLRMTVEVDEARFRGIRDSLTLNTNDLEQEIELLKKELVQMRRNHEEDMNELRLKNTGSVNVEVDSAESVDLTKVLQEVRDQYEALVEKNKLELEQWFQSKVDSLKTQICLYQEDVKMYHTELSEVSRSNQTLEIQRNSMYAEIKCLQENLEEVQSQYSSLLHQLQFTINTLEAELQQLKASLDQNQVDYSQLLDINMRLKMEIAEYRRLLDGEQSEQKMTVIISKMVEEKEEHMPRIEKRVKTIVEEIVDGQVVASSVETQVQTLQ
ncbi:keratin, type I cytoskeletal 19-like [Pholidichthys leucotaenia]